MPSPLWLVLLLACSLSPLSACMSSPTLPAAGPAISTGSSQLPPGNQQAHKQSAETPADPATGSVYPPSRAPAPRILPR